MNEINFRQWMITKEINKKVQSDYISRLKRIEREINSCNIDEQYHNDRCAYLLSLFANMGKNQNMEQYPNTSFPIGKYYMNTYRLALRKYILFCDETISSENQ